MEGGGDTAMCCVGAGCVTGQPSRSAAFETSINNQEDKRRRGWRGRRNPSYPLRCHAKRRVQIQAGELKWAAVDLPAATPQSAAEPDLQ